MKNFQQGDSGGPLLCGPNHTIQYGIVSIGRECSSKVYGGIYTSVKHFHDWIDLAVGKLKGNICTLDVCLKIYLENLYIVSRKASLQ